MSIAIKVPALPYAATEARIGHWYKAVNEVIARGEILVELQVRGEVIPVLAPQAGLVERIFFPVGAIVAVTTVIALLKTGLPNLVWDSEQEMLILETYRAEGVTTSMEYELRELLRQGKAKYGKGFGSGLALPQIQNPQQDLGAGPGQGYPQHFKPHPALAPHSQFSGNFKNPQVNAVPRETQIDPQYAPSLSPKAQPRIAPTPSPKGG